MSPRAWLVVLGFIVSLGCDTGKPKGDLPPLHPTTGRVVRGGAPVSGGSLQLQPDPAIPNLTITAEVKPDGTFEVNTLHTQSQKKAVGAPAGNYRATYMPALGDQTQGGAARPAPVTPAQSYTVKEGPNELTIELGKK